MNKLSPYTIPNLKTYKNGKQKLVKVNTIKWFEQPMRTITVTRHGKYQNIKYTPFNPGSRRHIYLWLKHNYGYTFPFFTPSGEAKVDVDSLENMEYPEGKLLKRYLKVVKDQSQLGGADGSIIKNYNENTCTVTSRVNTNGTLCVTKDTTFDTDTGPKFLKQLTIGDRVLTAKGSYESITDIFNNDIKPIIKITTENGLELATTYNHPYLVANSWINAEDLKIGMSLTTVHEKETWTKIPFGGNYSISTWGRVRNDTTNKYLKLQKKKDRNNDYGNLKVTLRYPNGTRKNGTLKDFSVHKLVLPLSKDKEVRHLNGIPYYNHASNLAEGTSKDNSLDAIHHGTSSKQQSQQAKLSIEIVKYIRSAKTKSINNTELARQLNVSRELVRDVRLGKRWVVNTAKKSKLVEFTTSKIIKIEHCNAEMTYGVTINKEHTHVTNGIVTHNTGRFTSSSINLAQIPAQKEFRELFSAPVYYNVPDDLLEKINGYKE